MDLRDEKPADIAAIRALTTRAFADAAHSSGTEAEIVDALRAAGALAVSLVATEDDAIVGHVAFSPVTIDGRHRGWFGLGPVSVLPERQGEGIGAALVGEGLRRLAADGAAGCVVLGDPVYYRRFGFVSDPALAYPGAPAEYFMRLVMRGEAPRGTVAYHRAFGA
jgi:putative acetyltransferase